MSELCRMRTFREALVDAVPPCEAVFGPRATGLGFLQRIDVGERGEGGGNEGPARGLNDARISIVDWAVMQDSWPSPCASVVRRGDCDDLSERADVGFAPSGGDDPQFTGASSNQRWPTDVGGEGADGSELSVLSPSWFCAGFWRKKGTGECGCKRGCGTEM